MRKTNTPTLIPTLIPTQTNSSVCELEQIEEMENDLRECHAEFYDNADIYTDYNETAKGMIAKGYRKQSEWISVDERLPEECKNVLCFARNKTMIAFMEKVEDCGEYVPVFWDWVAYDRDDTYDEVCATHWMPLPEPPKGD